MSRKKTQNNANIILERISQRFNLTNDDEIAEHFCVKRASVVSSWRQRNSPPYDLICEKYNPEELFFILYGQHIPALTSDDPKPDYPPEIKKECDKLAVILQSDDEATKIAIKTNLDAFVGSVKKDDKIKEQAEEISEIREDVKTIRNEMALLRKSKFPPEKRGQNGKKTASHSG
jgi:hypothetical protein